MKTAEERAKETVDEWLANPEKGLCKIIENALKEQDRDTRHACAEAVLALSWWATNDRDSTIAIDRDAAHAACMNVKAC